MRHFSLFVFASVLAVAGSPAFGQAPQAGPPAVGVVQHAGEATLFSPETSRDASAIDVTAAITNVRVICSEAGGRIVSQLTFDVVAQRAGAGGARTSRCPISQSCCVPAISCCRSSLAM